MRLTEAEHRGLKAAPNRALAITLPPREPKPGAPKAKAPVIVGHSYTAHTTINVGEDVVKREIRVTVTEITEHEEGGWTCSVVAGDRTDVPRLLARGNGYTSSSAAALQSNVDPGEAVPEGVQRKWSEEAFQRDGLLRAQRIAAARLASQGLRKIGRDGERAADRFEHVLNRLEGEQESEAA